MLQGSIISLIQDIQMSTVTWGHIEVIDIILQNFFDEDNHKVENKYSTVFIHRYDV
jgi:hypothetical protein